MKMTDKEKYLEARNKLIQAEREYKEAKKRYKREQKIRRRIDLLQRVGNDLQMRAEKLRYELEQPEAARADKYIEAARSKVEKIQKKKVLTAKHCTELSGLAVNLGQIAVSATGHWEEALRVVQHIDDLLDSEMKKLSLQLPEMTRPQEEPAPC